MLGLDKSIRKSRRSTRNVCDDIQGRSVQTCGLNWSGRSIGGKEWKTYRQNVLSIPTYNPNNPSFLTTFCKTSIGPANVLDLSWSLNHHIWFKLSSTKDKTNILDLDQLKRNDNETLCGSGTTTCQDWELLCHLRLARQGQVCFAPKVICSTVRHINLVDKELASRTWRRLQFHGTFWGF